MLRASRASQAFGWRPKAPPVAFSPFDFSNTNAPTPTLFKATAVAKSIHSSGVKNLAIYSTKSYFIYFTYTHAAIVDLF